MYGNYIKILRRDGFRWQKVIRLLMRYGMAFTAEWWGDIAVVSRAIEGLPGPIVDQQFGFFHTWTQANAFAARLNEGLEIDPACARRIVISSVISAGHVFRTARLPDSCGQLSNALSASDSMDVPSLLSQMDQTLAFAHFSLARERGPCRAHIVCTVEALMHNARFYTLGFRLRGQDKRDREDVVSRMELLQLVWRACSLQKQDSAVSGATRGPR